MPRSPEKAAPPHLIHICSFGPVLFCLSVCVCVCALHVRACSCRVGLVVCLFVKFVRLFLLVGWIGSLVGGSGWVGGCVCVGG